MLKRLVLITCLLSSTSALAAVTVVGGGLSHACSLAALDGRKDLESLALCSQALSDEMMLRDARAGTFVNRGVIQLRRAAYDDARADFDAAIRLDARLGEAYVNRGASLIAQRDYRAGIEQINFGLELEPEEPEKAYFNRALAYERLDDLKAAWSDFKQAEALAPDWSAPRTELLRYTVTAK